MTVVVLYGKPQCSLCDKAAAILAHLRREFAFEVEYVDITTDAGLFARYRERIPVLAVDGREIASTVVTTPALRSALRALADASAGRAAADPSL
jgi:glutaredoxin